MALKEEYKNQIIEIIHRHIPNCTIYLFGSRATGQERSGSDIDIAIDTGRPVSFETKIKILREIDDTTIPLEVDFVDLQTANEELKKDVAREGVLWTS
jgi:predicted nucleotidyltransferase